MRSLHDNDFFIDLAEVGRFRFGRKTYGDHIKIRAEHLRVLGSAATSTSTNSSSGTSTSNASDATLTDNDPVAEIDIELDFHAWIVSHYKILCAACPPGWEDLEALDLSEAPERVQHIIDLYLALRDKQDSFRRTPRANPQGEATRQDLGGDTSVLVSQPLSPTSE